MRYCACEYSNKLLMRGFATNKNRISPIYEENVLEMVSPKILLLLFISKQEKIMHCHKIIIDLAHNSIENEIFMSHLTWIT